MIKKLIAFILVILCLLVISSCFFVVHQKEYVVVLQFGRIVRVDDNPGMGMKMHFIQGIQRISKRMKIYDLPKSGVITQDKKNMVVDCYVVWEVSDPIKFIQTLSANDILAQERIEASTYNVIKNTISSISQDVLIKSRGGKLSGAIESGVNAEMGKYGLFIIHAAVKALDLPDDNKKAVYARMISERKNIAAAFTAEGKSEAQKIVNATDKAVQITIADAEKQAAVMIAEGEAEYMRIMSEAYDGDDKAEFYSYLRGLDAIKKSMVGENKTLILGKDSELAKVLYGGFADGSDYPSK